MIDYTGRILLDSYGTKKGLRWRYRFEVPSPHNKRVYKSQGGFLKQKDALQAGQNALSLYLQKGKVYSSDICFEEFIDKWIVDDASRRCKEQTIIGYKKKIKNLIKPTLKNYKLKDINREMLIDLLLNLYDEGYSYNTLSGVKGILSSSFRYALSCDLIPFSPAQDLKIINNLANPPQHTTRPKPNIFLTTDPINLIFKRFPAGNPNHLPLMIAYHCGLRLGEVYALTWEDINWENKTLSVNRQVQWKADSTRKRSDKIINNGSTEAGDGFWYFCEPKKRSFRTIDLDDTIFDLLKREKSKSEFARNYAGPSYIKYYSENPLIYNGSKNIPIEPNNKIVYYNTGNEIHFVMTRGDGSYITPRTKNHTTRIIKYKLGIPDFTFHSLRHTHSTMLRDAGCPEIYISKRLGHANINTTVQIYTNHLTDTIKDIGNEKLLNLYNNNIH